MPDPLSSEQVRRIATLARLDVADADVEALRADLSAVLGYMARLRTLDLKDVEPLAHVGRFTNRFRDDEPGPTIDTETAMKLAPRTDPPFFSVPKVIDGGGGGT